MVLVESLTRYTPKLWADTSLANLYFLVKIAQLMDAGEG